MDQHARFLKGSILKHVITMSATNAIGLSAIFFVDLIDIFFISLLENSAYTVCYWLCQRDCFFTTSISIALGIANSAIVSRYIGQNKRALARQYVAHISLFSVFVSSLIAALIWYFAPDILTILGAKSEGYTQAVIYLRTIIPAVPILALTMQMNATLRSISVAKHAMYATLLGAIVNALLDPLFIFVFSMDLQGATIASVIARLSALLLSLYYVLVKYKMVKAPNLKSFLSDVKIINQIALPASLTQVATPLGNIYVTYEIAKYGTEYIAGWAIMSRIIPVAFAMMFAISGAIGPIIGQNYGQYNFQRIQSVLNESLKFVTSYCLVIALLLSFAQEQIVLLFNAKQQVAEFIRLFCHQISFTFMFMGMTFVSMAFLNNLGYAKYATLLNVGKMLLGTIPFVTIGSYYYGATGILYGQALGSIVFGLIALFFTHRILKIVQDTDH
ncbi:MATE family efflux transporter [Psychromonas sp. KJ10-10]|uniref:MATE family efflux transporter n=1 Tax=Psychromonas sp. KJ10-10 TaxID=3391823 RepID=UPI0039B57B96